MSQAMGDHSQWCFAIMRNELMLPVFPRSADASAPHWNLPFPRVIPFGGNLLPSVLAER
jgi:hypothetical protein